jgi:hypothetical protein
MTIISVLRFLMIVSFGIKTKEEWNLEQWKDLKEQTKTYKIYESHLAKKKDIEKNKVNDVFG